jgi:hypothetical protein
MPTQQEIDDFFVNEYVRTMHTMLVGSVSDEDEAPERAKFSLDKIVNRLWECTQEAKEVIKAELPRFQIDDHMLDALVATKSWIVQLADDYIYMAAEDATFFSEGDLVKVHMTYDETTVRTSHGPSRLNDHRLFCPTLPHRIWAHERVKTRDESDLGWLTNAASMRSEHK